MFWNAPALIGRQWNAEYCLSPREAGLECSLGPNSSLHCTGELHVHMLTHTDTCPILSPGFAHGEGCACTYVPESVCCGWVRGVNALSRECVRVSLQQTFFSVQPESN